MPALQRVEVLPGRGRVPFTYVTIGGDRLTVCPATGGEAAELDALLRACLAGSPPSAGPDGDTPDWTAADLRSVLRPPGGGCLLARTSDGTLVALGSTLPADDLDPAAGDEPVLLVHPAVRGHRLGHWMRHLLTHHRPDPRRDQDGR